MDVVNEIKRFKLSMHWICLWYIFRSTAFGIQSSMGRIAGLLGNVTFGNLIGISKAIPILITASLMAIGGSITLKLPETKERLL